MDEGFRADRRSVVAIGTAVITIALFYLLRQDLTYVHIDAIAHVNKARGLWDNLTPGLKQLGSSWLPLQHLLIAPLTLSDYLWTTGLAGSLLSAACFVVAGWFMYGIAARWTGSRAAGWLAFLLFAANPRIIYLFTTPMTEPLMVACAAGVIYYLMEWSKTPSWGAFARVCLMAFAGTLTRYEGWPIAGMTIPLVFLLARTRRLACTILFAGAAVFGPMLWMIYNMAYFDDPLMFIFGRGSARDYAQEYFFRTGKLFPTAGQAWASLKTFWIDVAYCVNPIVLWFAVAGIAFAWTAWRHGRWRATIIPVALAVAPFLYYSYSLYANYIPLEMPGLIKDEPDSIFNVRYGTVMAAVLPVLAAFAIHLIFKHIERRRVFALSFLAAMFLPNPIPQASDEAPPQQLTANLFYTEGLHNQSFWLPPFIEVADRLAEDIAAQRDESSSILTNSRIVHPVVWATGIHMKRFIHEMNKTRWDASLNVIDPAVRWVITEEGDQLWHAQGKRLQGEWTEVATARTPSTGIVHLYRRP
jgi:hypothetical protein